MLNFLWGQMDDELFSWLCRELPTEIVCIIDNEVMGYYRNIWKDLIVVNVENIERSGRSAFITRIYPNNTTRAVYMHYCEKCGGYNAKSTYNISNDKRFDNATNNRCKC